APNWPPPEWMSLPTWSVIVMSIAILLLGWSGRRSATSGLLRDAMLRPALWINAIGSAAALLVSAYLIAHLPPPTSHAYYATMLVMLSYLALHVFIALIIA